MEGYTKINITYYIKNTEVIDIIKIMDKVEEITEILNIPFNPKNVLYINPLNEIHVFGGYLNA